MPSLFRAEDQNMTEAACDLDEAATSCISYLFRQYLAQGYPAREISHIILSVVFDLEMRAILGDDLALWDELVDPSTPQELAAYTQRYTLEPQATAIMAAAETPIEKQPIEKQPTITMPAIQVRDGQFNIPHRPQFVPLQSINQESMVYGG